VAIFLRLRRLFTLPQSAEGGHRNTVYRSGGYMLKPAAYATYCKDVAGTVIDLLYKSAMDLHRFGLTGLRPRTDRMNPVLYSHIIEL
jgi:hypothetical protein